MLLKYTYKAYIKRNIVSNLVKKKLGSVKENVLIETPFDYGDIPKLIYIKENTTLLKNARLNIYENQRSLSPVIEIGRNCYIGEFFSILAKEQVKICDNVLIASNVLILSENHGIDPENELPYMSQPLTGKCVLINEGCWIGQQVIILPGVTIGKKSIIGAGSVVTKSIPAYCIAAGNPAKILKKFNFTSHRWEIV